MFIYLLFSSSSIIPALDQPNGNNVDLHQPSIRPHWVQYNGGTRFFKTIYSRSQPTFHDWRPFVIIISNPNLNLEHSAMAAQRVNLFLKLIIAGTNLTGIWCQFDRKLPSTTLGSTGITTMRESQKEKAGIQFTYKWKDQISFLNEWINPVGITYQLNCSVSFLYVCFHFHRGVPGVLIS